MQDGETFHRDGILVEAKRKAPKSRPDLGPHPFNILFSGLGVWGSGGGGGEVKAIIVEKAE